jgi:hypothetical protein
MRYQVRTSSCGEDQRYITLKGGGVFISEIPYKFKVQLQLEFIRINLPMACIVADYTR